MVETDSRESTLTPRGRFYAFLSSYDTEPTELGLGYTTILCGLWVLFFPYAEFLHPARWGTLLVAVGAARIYAVLADRPWLRAGIAVISGALWVFTAVWFARERPWAMTIPLTIALASSSLWVFLRLSTMIMAERRRRRATPPTTT